MNDPHRWRSSSIRKWGEDDLGVDAPESGEAFLRSAAAIRVRADQGSNTRSAVAADGELRIICHQRWKNGNWLNGLSVRAVGVLPLFLEKRKSLISDSR